MELVSKHDLSEAIKLILVSSNRDKLQSTILSLGTVSGTYFIIDL